jgi:cell wall-associated NlpC family hydrolase
MKLRALSLIIALSISNAGIVHCGAAESEMNRLPQSDVAAQDLIAAQPGTSSAQGLMQWAGAKTQDLLATSLSLMGVKYRVGSNDPGVGFDCSGFVQHVYKQAVGLLLPHSAYSMSLQGKTVAVNDLQPGDLVFFNTVRRQFSHVGIYIGENRFIHAPSHGKGVQVDDMNDIYWGRRFNGARRLDTDATPPSSAP